MHDDDNGGVVVSVEEACWKQKAEPMDCWLMEEAAWKETTTGIEATIVEVATVGHGGYGW